MQVYRLIRLREFYIDQGGCIISETNYTTERGGTQHFPLCFAGVILTPTRLLICGERGMRMKRRYRVRQMGIKTIKVNVIKMITLSRTRQNQREFSQRIWGCTCHNFKKRNVAKMKPLPKKRTGEKERREATEIKNPSHLSIITPLDIDNIYM